MEPLRSVGSAGIGAALAGLPPWTLWVAVWVLWCALGLAIRPLVPLVEVRYLAVAWEMWTGHEFLVPHLNGEPYAHKPPLLFWLVHVGWWLFGVNAWWPRLVVPLVALAALGLTQGLARRLWPEREGVPNRAAWLLTGTVAWLIYGALTMFDVLLAAAALLGLIALWDLARGRSGALLALAVGLGILAKGPVILLHLVPLVVLWPWWGRLGQPIVRPLQWYGRAGTMLAAGVLLAGVWAVPAALHGGSDYAASILWEQSAGRVVTSFAHAHPWWWYAPVALVAFLPWTLWPRAWRTLARVPGSIRTDPGLRLLLIWLGSAGLLLSGISGKQVHYLVPLCPGLALLLARLLDPPPNAVGPAPSEGRGARAREPAARLAVLTVGVLALAQTASAPLMIEHWDTGRVARRLAQAEREGRPVAQLDGYHGQYQFSGRLMRPAEIVMPVAAQISAWASAHPRGILVGRHRGSCPLGYRATPLMTDRYRGRVMSVWESESLQKDPTLALAPCAERAGGEPR